MYINVSTENLSTKSISPQPKVSQPTQSVSPTSQTNSLQSSPLITSQSSVSTDDRNLIRIDANRLLKCADELCEKHLYYDENKHNFKQEVKDFATDIITQVDNGSMTYQQGAKKIKEEEDSLLEQSLEWIARGLSILGGIGLMMAGAAMCTTGVGCIVGAYLGAHGANSIQEGVFGGDGFLKSTYQEAAKQLGMSESVGSLVYDLVDMGISVKGKLKLVPKIGELGEPVKKLWYYGRQDLVRYYRQMGKWALRAEIGSDMLSLYSVIDDIKNVFVYDKDNDESSLSFSEPETITNIGELVDNCEMVIVLTFDENEETPRHYYRCTRPNGEQYNIE